MKKLSRRLVIGVLGFSLQPFVCSAQQKPVHPIDKALEECMDKDPSTAGMAGCLGEAYDRWDKELNRAYNDLMRKLKPAGKRALRAAQTEWIQYRDKEFALIDVVYSGLDGSMYIPIRVSDRVEIVKKRAIELKDYIDLLNGR